MKKATVIFLLLFCFVSCSNNEADNSISTNYYGKWRFTKITGVFIPALNMERYPQWQEFYEFKTDGTLKKQE